MCARLLYVCKCVIIGGGVPGISKYSSSTGTENTYAVEIDTHCYLIQCGHVWLVFLRMGQSLSSSCSASWLCCSFHSPIIPVISCVAMCEQRRERGSAFSHWWRDDGRSRKRRHFEGRKKQNEWEEYKGRKWCIMEGKRRKDGFELRQLVKVEMGNVKEKDKVSQRFKRSRAKVLCTAS